MNLNIIAYGLYFSITAFIILRIGWLFYHFGAVYLHDLYPNQPELANSLNSILLIGYYLLNLGYVALSLSYWPALSSTAQMLALLFDKIGFICIALGVIHFANMAWVRLLKNKNQIITNNKFNRHDN